MHLLVLLGRSLTHAIYSYISYISHIDTSVELRILAINNIQLCKASVVNIAKLHYISDR